MKKLLFNRTTFFLLFALIAIALMGTTFAKPVSSDLRKTAETFINESSSIVRSTATANNIQISGAILRANAIK